MADDMLQRALRRARLTYRGLKLQTWEEYIAEDVHSSIPRSVVLAEGHLVDATKTFSTTAWNAVQQQVQNVLRINLDEREWRLWEDNWAGVSVQQYQRAVLPGGGYTTSTLYPLSRSRDGTWVMVPYMPSSETEVANAYVARVNYYLRLSVHTAAGEQVLRLAMCDFLSYREPFSDPDICDLILFGHVDRDDKGQVLPSSFTSPRNYPVLLQTIAAPLFAHVHHEGQSMAFVPFRFTTGGACRNR